MDKKGNAMAMGFVALIIAVIFFSVVATFSNNATQYQSQTDTFTSQPVPYNVTLSKDDIMSLTSVTNSSGGTISTKNYTDYVTLGKLEITDNGTIGTAGYITYNYKEASYIEGGTTRMIATFLPILVLVIIILYLMSMKQ